MDARLYDDVLQFIECIMDTPEYLEYRTRKQEIENHPELREKAEELKEKNLELRSRIEGNTNALSDALRFADENEEILMEPVVSGYLASEAAFCRMMREIFNMLMERVDM